MFRSDRMAFCEMYLQPEAAFDAMARLGDMGCVEFKDMNEEVPAYLKNYMAEVCRCAELERRMRYIENEIKHDNIAIAEPLMEPPPLHFNEMARFENKVEKWETDILEIAGSESNLKQDLLEMKEMRYVLRNIGEMLGKSEIGLEKIVAKSKQGVDQPLGSRLYVMTGVVKRTRSFPFELMLWRVSRGNIYYRQADHDEVLEDPYTGGEIRKVGFLAFCQGEILAKRMQKIFTGFRVNIYPCPETYVERMDLLHKVEDRIVDLEDENTESNVESFVTTAKTEEEPPTVQCTNKFTYGFQMLINAYGDSKYGEVNPGIFTIVSFPFLFAIMFGDGGHALIMVCFAAWMLIYESDFIKQPGSEIWNIFFGGRYVIFLLGIFSLFTGFVYNDVFSRAMNFSNSMWGNIYTKNYLSQNALIDIDSKNRLYRPYVFGLDPIWTISRNKIMIENSIKMKMSLVIGIIHMLFGVTVSIFNHIHFKKYYLVVLQFIPQFLFLFCIFFWLVLLIIYKWIFFYSGHENPRYGCSCAPQILILFIDMVLYSSTEKKPPERGCEIFLFDLQPTLQPILVTVSLVMVPILLFGPPLYANMLNKKMRKEIMKDMTSFRKYQQSDGPDPRLLAKLDRYNRPFGELMILQAVHTIEFVLSTISHTASYLRLWALSLAHSQLSEMLWIMILSKLSLQDHSSVGVVKIFIAFPIWALFTVAILVVMEGLSAFLHTLRLHWVEFMSKFFIGGGRNFKPFYFKQVLGTEVKAEGACTGTMRKRQKLTVDNVHLSNVTMLRSVTIVPCHLYLQPATAFDTMYQLGENNCVQFIDMHSGEEPTVRSYTMDLNRCIELERKLFYLEHEMLKEYDRIHIPYPEKDPKPIHPSEMAMFESLIEKWENDIIENSENLNDLKHDVIELKEMKSILKDIGPMLDKSRPDMDDMLIKFQDGRDHGTLYIFTGVIDRIKSYQCQIMLWRISVGNIYYREADRDLVVENLNMAGKTTKVAFMAACQGEELRSRLEKVCEAFKATFYPCPQDPEKRAELIDKVDDRIADLNDVLYKSKYYRCMALRSVGKQWRGWLIQVRKSKTIYQNMNLMVLDLPKNCLIGRAWIAERDIAKVQKIMDACTAVMGVRAPSMVTQIPNVKTLPPTLQETNKFTRAPQAVINAFGHARYKEVNPALFTIIGLPFLFAVMFSDMGHGVLLVMIALWMIACEKDLREPRGNEVWDLFFDGRYMLLMMGIWSVYAGFCFNQLFTKSINLSATNSMYKNVNGEGILKANEVLTLGGKARVNNQYIWGMDPMWQMAKNKIEMKNSHMMKLAIIIGILHMLFGILVSVVNHRYFKNSYAIIVQFLPQFLFLACLFGWTVVLIYWKWWFYYDGHADETKSAACAPPILPHFVARFMPVDITLPKDCNIFFFDAQPLVQSILNMIVILSIFLLLFGTPLYIHIFNLRTKRNLQKEMRIFRGRHMKGCKLSCLTPCGDLCDEACRKQEEKWQAVIDRHSTPFCQLLTNQLIHTIDFVLGTISHVASYLRLWALGMGHYLIADTLWMMVLRSIGMRDLSENGYVTLFFAFALFATLTFIVLVVMEGLCCFLHALRLHWVEFMGKFYVDEGYPFTPFNFKNVSSETYIKTTGSRFNKSKRHRKKGNFFKSLTTKK